MKVEKPDNKTSPCVWDAWCESLIALLAINLARARAMDAKQVVYELNLKYLIYDNRASSLFPNFSKV